MKKKTLDKDAMIDYLFKIGVVEWYETNSGIDKSRVRIYGIPRYIADLYQNGDTIETTYRSEKRKRCKNG